MAASKQDAVDCVNWIICKWPVLHGELMPVMDFLGMPLVDDAAIAVAEPPADLGPPAPVTDILFP